MPSVNGSAVHASDCCGIYKLYMGRLTYKESIRNFSISCSSSSDPNIIITTIITMIVIIINNTYEYICITAGNKGI
jgi:predicted membrane protein